MFQTLGFRYEKAAPATVVRLFSVVLAFIYEITILNENIEWTSILGASLILGCVLIIGLVKWCSDEDTDDKKSESDEI